jgi:hypothetical protein
MKCQKKGHLGREAFFIITLLNDKWKDRTLISAE